MSSPPATLPGVTSTIDQAAVDRALAVVQAATAAEQEHERAAEDERKRRDAAIVAMRDAGLRPPRIAAATGYSLSHVRLVCKVNDAVLAR